MPQSCEWWFQSDLSHEEQNAYYIKYFIPLGFVDIDDPVLITRPESFSHEASAEPSFQSWPQLLLSEPSAQSISS